LAMMEKYCAKTSRTMLVDFDMHNRGLTSLLDAWKLSNDRTTSCFQEMIRFWRNAKGKLETTPALMTGNSPTTTHDRKKLTELMDEFAREGQAWRPLNALQLLASPTAIRGQNVPHDKAWFLPS